MTTLMNPKDLDRVDEKVLNNLITELGLNKKHNAPDPRCFICRQPSNWCQQQKHIELSHSFHVRRPSNNTMKRK